MLSNSLLEILSNNLDLDSLFNKAEAESFSPEQYQELIQAFSKPAVIRYFKQVIISNTLAINEQAVMSLSKEEQEKYMAAVSRIQGINHLAMICLRYAHEGGKNGPGSKP